MPKIGSKVIYYWSKKEREEHNTERHQLFKKEIYPYLSLPAEDRDIIIAEFLTRYPEFLEE